MQKQIEMMTKETIGQTQAVPVEANNKDTTTATDVESRDVLTVPSTGSGFGAIETPGNLLDIDKMMTGVASVSASDDNATGDEGPSTDGLNLDTQCMDEEDEDDDDNDLWNHNGITPMGITDDGSTMQ